jgi:hypothetical protein
MAKPKEVILSPIRHDHPEDPRCKKHGDLAVIATRQVYWHSKGVERLACLRCLLAAVERVL